MTRRGWMLFLAMGVIWGIPYLLIKVTVAELSPVALVMLRTGTGALLLLPIAAARGQLIPLLPRWRWLLLFSVVELAVPWLLLSQAERRLSSSLAGLLVAAVPFAGAAIALAIGSDDRLDRRRAVGLAVGLVGVAALVGLDFSGGDLPAYLEIAVVIAGYAAGPAIITQRLSDLPPLGVIAASLGLTALAYAPVGLTQLPAHLPSTPVILSLAGLGVVCTALAFVLFFSLIAEVGPVRATVITYVNPAVALLLGVAVLRERLTVAEGVGFALVLAGSVLATRRSPPARRDHVVAAVAPTVPAAPVGAP